MMGINKKNINNLFCIYKKLAEYNLNLFNNNFRRLVEEVSRTKWWPRLWHRFVTKRLRVTHKS